ncbi:MAG: hypothetical protein CMD25_08340 [Flavobacteriales bacterium]|nr:hypothetical protein [Flavobacteriales bacterium]
MVCPRTPEFDIYTPQTAKQNSAQTPVNQAVTYLALAVPFAGRNHPRNANRKFALHEQNFLSFRTINSHNKIAGKTNKFAYVRNMRYLCVLLTEVRVTTLFINY